MLRKERTGNTVQNTTLVNVVYLRLVVADRTPDVYVVGEEEILRS